MEKPHIIQGLVCFPADVLKPAYCIRVIDRCRVRPANRYVSASFVYIKSHLLRTVRQERGRKRLVTTATNWKVRPTRGPLQGRLPPCPVAICQTKEKGDSGTDVSEIVVCRVLNIILYLGCEYQKSFEL
jgi:hypothetical protein